MFLHIEILLTMLGGAYIVALNHVCTTNSSSSEYLTL